MQILCTYPVVYVTIDNVDLADGPPNAGGQVQHHEKVPARDGESNGDYAETEFADKFLHTMVSFPHAQNFQRH